MLVRLILRIGAWRRDRAIKNAAIPLDAKCPACGHRKPEGHKLRAVMVEEKNQKPEPFVEHICAVCGAPWYEPTVLKGEKWLAPKVSKIQEAPPNPVPKAATAK